MQDLDDLDWSEGIKEMQRNWIGKSVGAEVTFKTTAGNSVTVYTTRPDTLFGATYMVLAPEHPLVKELTTPENAEAVKAYQEAAAAKSELDRTSDNSKEKTGCFTGSYAIDPVNGREIPIWIADYVLISYGTGAIMAVPAHDTRDFDFAKAFGLPVICIIEPDAEQAKAEGVDVAAVLRGEACWTGEGKLINSANEDGLNLNGMSVKESKPAATRWLEERGMGKEAVKYKLRDWLFSRQRYWGEPFPIIHFEDGSIELVDESELPVALPDMEDFKPSGTGEPPLSKAPAEWLNYTCPKTGRKGRRELNTMPQWAGSCWYYLRYIDPKNENVFCDPELLKHWMPVDLYVGGPEHAVGHLIYSRIWNRFLYDEGLSPVKEPFKKLVHQGMILGENGIKMGKRFPEFVVNPSDIVRDYGADTLRLYEMFMGPLEVSKPWSTTGVAGAKKFINRVWNFFSEPANIVDADDGKLTKVYHQTVKKVTSDFEQLGFNTAIAQMMVFINDISC